MNILLVSMPFADLGPSIGPSLLKGQLDRLGIPSRVTYLTLPFAQRIGGSAYSCIAEHLSPALLAGEWVFAHCLFGDRAASPEKYVEILTSRRPDLTKQQVGYILRARSMAAPFLDECLERVDWASYDMVGFTTNFSQNVPSLALAQRLKERFPHLRIAFGGANCEGEMGLQLHRSFPFIDFVATNEADISFPQLVRGLTEHGKIGTIRGIVSRQDGESRVVDLLAERVTDLDTLPSPNYDDFFEQFDRTTFEASYRRIRLQTSRGCWWGTKHHCTFCGFPGVSLGYRLKSPKRALAELEELTGRYGTQYVEMVDDILPLPYFQDFLPQLAERKLGLSVFYETKANLSREQVRLLRDAGVRDIQPGIESFSTDILRLMRKGTSAMQNVQLLKWCKQYGIFVHWNILYGFPGEDPAAYAELPALIDSLHHLQPPTTCCRIRLDRFSPYFDAPDHMGMTNIRVDRAYRYVYDLSDEELGNLAYYFEYDYADGRDPMHYASDVETAYRRWKANADEGALVYTDNGSTLIIRDSRANALKPVVVLSTRERELYLYCDQNRSVQQIEALAEQFGMPDGEVQRYLRRLLDLRLMATADGRYVSLAVPAQSAAVLPSHDWSETDAVAV